MSFQKCPKCDGQGIVSKPPYVPGDVSQWSSVSTAFLCDVCKGSKIIWCVNGINLQSQINILTAELDRVNLKRESAEKLLNESMRTELSKTIKERDRLKEIASKAKEAIIEYNDKGRPDNPYWHIKTLSNLLSIAEEITQALSEIEREG